VCCYSSWRLQLNLKAEAGMSGKRRTVTIWIPRTGGAFQLESEPLEYGSREVCQWNSEGIESMDSHKFPFPSPPPSHTLRARLFVRRPGRFGTTAGSMIHFCQGCCNHLHMTSILSIHCDYNLHVIAAGRLGPNSPPWACKTQQMM